jgi:phosphatidylethanolamine/phosphatidyl-N-methylethanolamine N-methyltransferase
MSMTNRGNRAIYRGWAPLYDAVLSRLFSAGRARAMQRLAPRAGEKILIPGVGTGLDLPLLPPGVTALGLDYSPEMLAQARRKLPVAAAVQLARGDAQRPLAQASFDALLLNLILSVIPDGQACLAAAWFALKPGGRCVIFDKFLPDAGRLTWGRGLLNQFSTRLGTDINRRFVDLSAGLDCQMVSDEPVLLGGMYRVICLQKPRP